MWGVWRLCVVLALASAGWVSSPPLQASAPPARPPNIILITLDTTRADRMGFLGSKRGLTPNLDALSRQSVVFTRAYAQVPLTTPSHAALLTGTYPQFNHLELLRDPLREDLPYVPDLLHQGGYRTAAFLGSLVLDPASGGGAGFERGFDLYDAGFHLPEHGEDRYHSVERRAGDVARRALDWLAKNQNQNQSQPFFIWLHFFDPHDPYDPPPPYKARYASAPYDGEIAYADSVVGTVMGALQERGLFANALIAVAADHGEALGEHGETLHGLLLYDETIHVPLLMKFPAGKYAGQRVEAPVALAEVAPSLLEAAGVAVPAAMQARSLLALAAASVREAASTAERGEEPARGAVYSATDYAHRTLGWSELRSWREGKYLYVQAPEKELYDQVEDPKAAKNLAPAAKAVAATLDAKVGDFVKRTSGDPAAPLAGDPVRDENLRALGYLPSVAEAENLVEKPQVDPKAKVKVVRLMQQATTALEAKRYEEALALIRQVVRDPDAVNAYLEFGTSFCRHERYRDAIPLLQTAAEKLPDSTAAHYELGMALIHTGRWEAALPQMRKAAALKPDEARLHFDLAAVYTRLKRVPEAMAECEKALQIAPDDFEANLTYGKLLLQQQHADAALSPLNRAVSVKPDSAEAHFFLGKAYHALGREQDAERERERAGELSAGARP